MQAIAREEVRALSEESPVPKPKRAQRRTLASSSGEASFGGEEMSHDDPTTDFLRRLERGENTDEFLEELTKLPPEHRANVIEALFRRLKKAHQNDEPD